MEISRFGLIFNYYLPKSFDIRLLKFSSHEINCYQFVIQLINKYENENIKLQNKWISISKSMTAKYSKQFNIEELFENFLSVYEQVFIQNYFKSIFWFVIINIQIFIIFQILEYSPNYETSCRLFPLFASIHRLDLRPFGKNTSKIMSLRLKMNENYIINWFLFLSVFTDCINLYL